MRADDVLGQGSLREWAFLAVGILLSLGLHTVVAAGASMIPERTVKKAEWVEMQLAETTPPPPPVVEKVVDPEPPKPDQQKPEPKKKVEKIVDLEDLPKDPPKDVPPAKKPVARATQGLSNDSLAPGAGGFGVRQGNTTATAQKGPPDPNAGPFVTVPYTSVGSAPKIRNNPPLDVPKEVADAHISGRVEMEITIDPEGRVIDAVVVGRLHPAADAACAAHAKRNVRFTPGTLDGAAVAVKGVPFSCRIEEATD